MNFQGTEPKQTRTSSVLENSGEMQILAATVTALRDSAET